MITHNACVFVKKKNNDNNEMAPYTIRPLHFFIYYFVFKKKKKKKIPLVSVFG